MTEAHVLLPPGTGAMIVSQQLRVARRRVFKAFSDPDHLPRWWGPEGVVTDPASITIDRNGDWRFVSVGPDGARQANRIRILAMVKPESLSYRYDGGDGEGDDPNGFSANLAFEKRQDMTLLTMTMLFATEAVRNRMVEMGAVDGCRSSLRKLSTYLSTMD